MKSFYIYIAAVLVINGAMPVFEKLTLGKVSVSQMIFLRGLVQLAIYTAVLFQSGEMASFQKVDSRFIIYGLLQGAVISVMLFCYFAAMKAGAASQVKAFSSAAPLLTYLLAVTILNEPLTLQRGLGVIFITLGVILIG